MAIDIDNVYQQVLAISNKDKRGYITPQEFNLFARKAQLDIFEGLFHEYKASFRIPGNNSSSSDNYEMLRDKIAVHRVHGGTVYANGAINSNTHWLEKVYDGNSYRKIELTFTPPSNITDNTSHITLRAIYSGDGYENAGEGNFTIRFNKSGGSPTDGSSLGSGTIWVNNAMTGFTADQVAGIVENLINDSSPYHSATIKAGSTDVVVVTYKQPGVVGGESTTQAGVTIGGVTSVQEHVVYEEVNKDDWYYIKGNKKLNPTKSSRGMFYRKSNVQLELIPNPGKDIIYDYIKKPADPNWTYVVINGKALFNSNASGKQDFELHASEENSLVNKILELAGVSIGDPNLSEVALRNEAIKEAKENR